MLRCLLSPSVLWSSVLQPRVPSGAVIEDGTVVGGGTATEDGTADGDGMGAPGAAAGGAASSSVCRLSTSRHPSTTRLRRSITRLHPSITLRVIRRGLQAGFGEGPWTKAPRVSALRAIRRIGRATALELSQCLTEIFLSHLNHLPMSLRWRPHSDRCILFIPGSGTSRPPVLQPIDLAQKCSGQTLRNLRNPKLC